jgi:protein-S-isoprenylcysteine O-methyltransferase Ste14
MSLIADFEIGLWNAWIFMLLVLLPLPLVILFHKGVFKKSDSIPASFYTRTEYKILIFSKIIMFSVFIYSIFLPLQLGTIWFYIGLSIYLLGLILQTIAWVNVATGPVDKPITKGLYRYSRHPMYVNLRPLVRTIPNSRYVVQFVHPNAFGNSYIRKTLAKIGKYAQEEGR